MTREEAIQMMSQGGYLHKPLSQAEASRLAAQVLEDHKNKLLEAVKPKPTPALKVFTCNNFKGHYPVGSAAVIIAYNETEAMVLLNRELSGLGFKQDETLIVKELNLSSPKVVILCDGNY